jgi:hypothetical protein
MKHIFLLFALALSWLATAAMQTASERIVTAIIRADYEGDRAALDRLFHELTTIQPREGNRRRAAQLHYWRGFAKWRRAINGFNVNAGNADLENDLRIAVAEFERSREVDPTFTDGSVAIIGCLQNLTFIHRNDQAKAAELVKRFGMLFKELNQSDPDNPRLAWLSGGGRMYLSQNGPPEERAKMQELAFETFRRGLENARKQKQPASVLEPSWGEPELLMSLSWASLNQAKPDVAAAEKYANEALALVPHFHYVKNILMPQIQAAKKNGRQQRGRRGTEAFFAQ